MLLRGYQSADDFTGNFWREKSARFATSFGIQSSIPPEPPAIAILTIVLGGKLSKIDDERDVCRRALFTFNKSD
jgi:hypothetical protein